MAKYDLIVIGAGINGLIAAARLVKFGLKKTLVLEKGALLGGCLRTNSNVFSGYKVDTGCQRLPHSLMETAKQLELQRFGLEFVPVKPCALWLLGEDVEVAVYEDLEATCQEIAKYSREEAANYRRLVQAWAPLVSQIEGVSAAPEITYTQFMQALESAGPHAMRLYLGKASDILRTFFSTDWMPGALARGALTSRASPMWPTSGFTTMFEIRFHWAPIWRPKGGMEALINSLVNMIRHHGGEVRTNSGVSKLLIEDRRAKGVRLESGEEIEANIIVSAAHFRVTYFDLVGEENLEPRFVTFLKGIVEGHSAFGVFLALDERPETRGNHIILTRGLREVEEAAEAIAKGRLPDPPSLAVENPCSSDPTLAPPGKYWLCMIGHAPYKLETTTWSAEAERYADRLIEVVNRRIPNIKGHIVGKYIQTPLDIERDYNLPYGALSGPERTFDQMFTLRPSYRSPIKNLYITGTGPHPGGGATAAPGNNVAKIVIKDLPGK